MSDRKRHGFVLLLVLGLICGSVAVMATKKTYLGLDLKGGIQLVYQGQPTAQTPKVTVKALNQAVGIMRSRVDALGVSQPSIQTEGNDLISASLPDLHDFNRAKNELGTPAQLFFYDWEANALLPDGKTVASQLPTRDPAAELISGGANSSGGGPGGPGGGSVSLFAAVTLAAKQPAVSNAAACHGNQTSGCVPISRLGAQYFLFGAPGSAACKTAAADQGTTPVQGAHCFLGGPDTSVANLKTDLAKGVTFAEGSALAVPQGTLVIQAFNPSTTAQSTPYSGPTAQFYVLRDRVSLRGTDITNPQQSTTTGGLPDVSFGLTSKGAKAFQAVTGVIAHRGASLSIGNNALQQHFMVSSSNAIPQILSAPEIDFKQYPDGIVSSGGSGGAEISGNFTTQSAQDLASELRSGALPITLKLISEEDVSASLGAKALHQGLIAGAAGLLVVVIFLLLYYRLLGLIATGTLIAYAVYFYALIKLIPITLTLAGIAGLILTIGVAADANIVIFERVKEEIRAGRSIRAGIATGYRKGLSAIIDANVVTIMVAFILFVLSTANVQGFAFTLGIGVIVSLFTAVLATQAILMTAADSNAIARPSALGAGKPKRKITFDFMGASRYFFSMSGMILLIGALAIGGRGLNLGIDFTSGTQATTTLVKHASERQVSAAASAAGAPNPTVVQIGKKGATFQISFKSGPGTSTKVKNKLTSEFGVSAYNQTSVGPTFGKAVAHSAVIAIIVALLLISVYVALRFDWKFAVPVLIALMHDLLITAGVYALVGRQVTVDTVAALLTILGYSLYDTIIVFDRVRENIPRMPRAAFSQIVNRSMSEVITRSLATTFCTLLPIVALLIFGGSTLRDFAFALLIGVLSGAYSSIFIASPVLTHWKERETGFRARRARISADNDGIVPAYATRAGDVEPRRRARARASLSSTPENEELSVEEFERLKADIADDLEPSTHTSSFMRRMAHTSEDELVEDEATAEPGARGTRAARAAGATVTPAATRRTRRSERLRAEAAEAAQAPPTPPTGPLRPPEDPAIAESAEPAAPFVDQAEDEAPFVDQAADEVPFVDHAADEAPFVDHAADEVPALPADGSADGDGTPRSDESASDEPQNGPPGREAKPPPPRSPRNRPRNRRHGRRR